MENDLHKMLHLATIYCAGGNRQGGVYIYRHRNFHKIISKQKLQLFQNSHSIPVSVLNFYNIFMELRDGKCVNMDLVNKCAHALSPTSQQKQNADHDSKTKHDEMSDIRQLIMDLKISVESHKDSVDRKLEELGRDMKNAFAEKIDSLKNYVELEVSQMTTKMDDLDTRLKAVESKPALKGEDYDPEVTVVATGVPFQEDEVIEDKVSDIVRRGLGLRDIPVVRSQRLRARGSGPGLVKIQLRTLEEKKTVLRAKQKLQNTEWPRVYLRSSKSHMERLNELNTKTLLKMIPGGQDMRLTGSGRLMHKDEIDRPPWQGRPRQEQNAGVNPPRFPAAAGGGGAADNSSVRGDQR